MFADWTIRGIIFTTRYFSGKWMKKVMRRKIVYRRKRTVHNGHANIT